MRRLVAVLVAPLLLGATPAVASARLPSVLTQLKPAFQVRPAKISYTGDGTAIVGGYGPSVRHPGHLRWTKYTRHEGLARGQVWLDDCDPSCAEGTFHPRAVRVRVFASHGGHFRRLTLRFRWHGKRQVDRRRARHFTGGGSSYWAYDIVGY
jgi:hypothetical protein